MNTTIGFDISADPATSARHLRALAAARGVQIGPVDPVDAAAAVVVADAWMVGTGALSFDGAGADYDILSAAVMRAAGSPRRRPGRSAYTPAGRTDPERAEMWGRWCLAHLGADAGADALRRAADDVAGADTPEVAGFAELLRDIADIIDDL